MAERLICFDIETYRTRIPSVVERVRDEALAKTPAQNVKKELKQCWHTEAAREARAAEALAKTAVDTLLAEPIVVSWKCGDTISQRTESLTAKDENELPEMLGELASVWDEITGPETIWCGHNLKGFDLPVLLNQWRRFQIPPPKDYPAYHGHWRGRIFDTMQRAPSGNGLGMVKMDTLLECYGVENPAPVKFEGHPMCGALVGAAYEAGELQTIIEYCEQDVRLTWELYMRMTCGDSWGTWDTESGVGEQVSEIEASDMTESAKALAIKQILDSAGMIPRAA